MTARAVAKLAVKVVPGASRSEVSGWLGETLKVRVAAQPEKGRANKAVVALLAEVLEIPVDRVSVVAGATSQRKLVEVQGLALGEVRRRLASRP
ncbi:MAG: DUF167 domain-containing protein [Halioglobus sp.]|nr:DUF167 domain-containing protein [Halioglobus sp.]